MLRTSWEKDKDGIEDASLTEATGLVVSYQSILGAIGNLDDCFDPQKMWIDGFGVCIGY